MRAEDLKLDELVRFSQGLVELHGHRYVLHDGFSMAQFRHDLVQMLGEDQARRVFTRFGYFWGQADAAAMKRLFNWDNIREWLLAGLMLHMLEGFAVTELKSLEINEAQGHFRMELSWHDSIEVDEQLLELGAAKRPSCWKMIGYASGYASYCMGKRVYFIEKGCKAAGKPECFAVGKDVDSWGAGELAAHLPYFQADAVSADVLRLSQQIREQQLELDRHRQMLQEAQRGPTIGGTEVRSRAFLKVIQTANRVAKFDISVLITGETGVGKELLARHLHSQSPRVDAPFLPVNCGALAETLLESELFGHKAGSFTGAVRDHAGLFEEARGGTIFLDEIGDITPGLQVKLLRVLQEHEIMRVGETRPRKVDIRVIAATNHDLEKAIAEGTFRKDLYYRLSVVRIHVPTLRERRDDVLPLARHFTKIYAKRLGLPRLRLDAASLDFILTYSWPGNVRELENAIEHAAVLCSDGLIRPENLPPHILMPLSLAEDDSGPGRSLEAVELEHIRRVLKETNGNRVEAARILKIGMTTLYRKLRMIKRLESKSW
jgi:DNA-binding NtrC family response regulator/predicted hydrocarbon binding protein